MPVYHCGTAVKVDVKNKITKSSVIEKKLKVVEPTTFIYCGSINYCTVV